MGRQAEEMVNAVTLSWDIPFADDVNDIVLIIDDILDDSRSLDTPIGYFAALYRHVAVDIERGLNDGYFDDPDMLAALDVVFFNRYVNALRSPTPPASWSVAFKEARDKRSIVLQHLLLGMNAHINFDLGVAVAEAVPANELAGFKDDFLRINQILGGVSQLVLNAMSVIWPLLGPINWIANDAELAFIDLTMRQIRELAWDLALRLSVLDGEAREKAIEHQDNTVADLGCALADPGFPLQTLVDAIQLGETGNVDSRIDDLLNNAAAEGITGKRDLTLLEKLRG